MVTPCFALRHHWIISNPKFDMGLEVLVNEGFDVQAMTW